MHKVLKVHVRRASCSCISQLFSLLECSGTLVLSPNLPAQAMAMVALLHKTSARLQRYTCWHMCIVRCSTHECRAVCPHTALPLGRYDDEWGDYRMVVGDHIGYRFEILSRLGKGSFGQVASLSIAAFTCTCMASHKQQTFLQSAQSCPHTSFKLEIVSLYTPIYCFLYFRL